MSRPPMAYITAYLQFAVAIIFLIGYFGLLAILFLGNATIPTELLELAKTLAVGLSGALGLLFAFLFLRSRTDGPPEPVPGQTTITPQTINVTPANHAQIVGAEVDTIATQTPPSGAGV